MESTPTSPQETEVEEEELSVFQDNKTDNRDDVFFHTLVTFRVSIFRCSQILILSFSNPVCSPTDKLPRLRVASFEYHVDRSKQSHKFSVICSH